MQNLWDFFENLNEVVYVSDMDTYDLVYMNRRAREVFHLKSNEELAGRKCYEFLYRDTAPCAMCTNDKLVPEQFHEWKYHNPIVGKDFLLKDTIIEKNGHRYRIDLAIDVTIQEEQERTIEEFLNAEALVNNALRLSLAADSPVKSLKVLIQHLGTSLHGDRVYIFEKTEDHHFCNTYEWCAHNVTSQKANLQHVPYEALQIWFQNFEKNQNIILSDIETIRDSDPIAYEYLLPQNIRSIIVYPLRFQDKVIGFYGIDNPPIAYMKYISTIFEVLGHFITSILRRRDLVKKLEIMSYYDQLTGALNRHAMNEYIAHVNHEQSIGLVYCDVMGLKRVNDSQGHLNGDDLLIRTYDCLKELFPKNSVFRIGGDEFLIMQSGISEEKLLAQIKKLRKEMPMYSVLLAIGYAWRPSCNGQILHLLKEADSLMYEDKRDYYERSENNRRT